MKTKPTLKDWIIAIRPWSFTVSALPAFVAMMYTIHTHPESKANWVLGVIAIIGAVIFHAGGNLISDYNDYKYGVDREGKVGTDILTSKLFAPRQVLIYGWTFIVTGIVLGLFLVSQVGTGLIWIGLFGTIGALFYYRFKFKALGDLLIFLVYGPTIMLGTGYVMLGHIDWTLLLVSFPMAFITVNVLHANNTRDVRSDRIAEIKTYAMVIGVKGSIIYYYLLTALAYVFIIAMVILNILPLPALIVLITLPVAIKNCKAMSQVTEDDVTPINDLDKGTAQLQLVFSASLSLALIIAIII
ncbi:prenyltransferase [Dysgonomonas sp. 521]|uniref:prenyltransferase n=1 Tax=Dysgonomonas sp. 521 TaxID=2302932 RepID=UPI0013D82809|nr:prenyltransferase [Dysgonomonas sp. 521]NDV94804.1 prenyltransferase [Dysgonomonas sp. 521]